MANFLALADLKCEVPGPVASSWPMRRALSQKHTPLHLLPKQGPSLQVATEVGVGS